MRFVTIHFEDRRNAALLRHKNRYEIDVLCVNGSPIRYVFDDGTRAIRFSLTLVAGRIVHAGWYILLRRRSLERCKPRKLASA